MRAGRLLQDQKGVTPIYPPNAEAVALFNKLGVAVPVDTAEAMGVLPVIACMMGTYYAFLQVTGHTFFPRVRLPGIWRKLPGPSFVFQSRAP